MKSQEKFFYDQIEIIQKDREEKECEFEKLLQEERAKARQCDVDSGSTKNHRLRWVTATFFTNLVRGRGVPALHYRRKELIQFRGETGPKPHTLHG